MRNDKNVKEVLFFLAEEIAILKVYIKKMATVNKEMKKFSESVSVAKGKLFIKEMNLSNKSVNEILNNI